MRRRIAAYEDATVAHCAVAILVGCEPTALMGRRDGLANANDAKQCGDATAYCAVGGDDAKRYEDATMHCAVVVLLGCVATARVRRCDTACLPLHCNEYPNTGDGATVRLSDDDDDGSRYPTVVLRTSAVWAKGGKWGYPGASVCTRNRHTARVATSRWAAAKEGEAPVLRRSDGATVRR